MTRLISVDRQVQIKWCSDLSKRLMKQYVIALFVAREALASFLVL